VTMPMPVRRWLHRRGLLHSPSWGSIYEQGTLLRPGRRYEYVPRNRRPILCKPEPVLRLVNTICVGTRPM
jgi:hypothetical protein